MITDWILLVLRIVAPLLLYLFLSLTILQMIARPKARSIPETQLRRLDQPDVILPLLPNTSLGRDLENTHVLDSKGIAPHHAVIAYQEPAWWVTDLGATNGTAVNNSPIESPTVLTEGDIITLGDIELRLEHGGRE